MRLGSKSRDRDPSKLPYLAQRQIKRDLSTDKESSVNQQETRRFINNLLKINVIDYLEEKKIEKRIMEEKRKRRETAGYDVR